MKIHRIMAIPWFFLYIISVSGQSVSSEFNHADPAIADSLLSGKNVLTIFVIPSKVKYDWTSPHTLYRSYVKNYKKNLFDKKSYLLGHTFVELRTARPEDYLYTGMRAADKKELKDLVLKEKYGLAILGADIKGRLEDENELRTRIDKFADNGRIAFIRLLVSDEAAARMIEFFHSYKTRFENNGNAGFRYGGAFWPRYYGEGSGCTAFVVTFLDLADLLQDQFDKWLLKIDIPMSLIGGPYNSGHEVSIKDIKKERSWENPDSSCIRCSVHLEIYDPGFMYDWIQEVRSGSIDIKGVTGRQVEIDNAPGILIDGRSQPLLKNDSIFQDRKTPSIFIDFYLHKSTYTH